MSENSDRSNKLSLWREGFRLFFAHWRAWSKLAIWFFIIFLPLQYTMLQEIMPFYKTMLSVLKSNPKDFVEQMKILPRPSMWPAHVLLFFYYVQAYFFMVFYLQRAPITQPPKPGIKNFFYALGKRALSYMVMFGWMILAILGSVVVIMILVHFNVPHVNGLLMPLYMGGMLYLMIRYAFVYTLAAGQIRSSLKVSARLVRGNFWRLIGNWLLLFLILLPLSLILWIAQFAAPDQPGNLALGLLVLIMALVYVIMGGVFSAFTCAAARILYNEKQAADPTFILTTST